MPSRFYNLLAVGRPVVLVSEPEAEAALTVAENGLGWVVKPGVPSIWQTSSVPHPDRWITPWRNGRWAAANFGLVKAMNGYAGLVDELLRNPELAEQR